MAQDFQKSSNLSTNKKPMYETSPLKTKTKITVKLIIGMVIGVAVAVGIGAVIFFAELPSLAKKLTESKPVALIFKTADDEVFKKAKDFLEKKETPGYADTDIFIEFNKDRGISLSTEKFAYLANKDRMPDFGAKNIPNLSSDEYNKCQKIKEKISELPLNENYLNYDVGITEEDSFKDNYAYIPSGAYMRPITLGTTNLLNLHNEIFKKNENYSPDLAAYFKTHEVPYFYINIENLAKAKQFSSLSSSDINLCAPEALRWKITEKPLMILYSSGTKAYPLPTAYGKTKISAYFYDKKIGELSVWVDYKGETPEIDFGGAVDMRFLRGKAVSKTFSASEFVDNNNNSLENIKELNLKIKTKADFLRGDVVDIYASNDGGKRWYSAKNNEKAEINEENGEKEKEFNFDFSGNTGSDLKLAFVFTNQKQLSTEERTLTNNEQIYPFKSVNKIGKGDEPKIPSYGEMNIDSLKTLFILKGQHVSISDKCGEGVDRKLTSKYEIQGAEKGVLKYPAQGDFAYLTDSNSTTLNKNTVIADYEGYDQLRWECKWDEEISAIGFKLSQEKSDARVLGVVVLPDDGTTTSFPLGISQVEMKVKGEKEKEEETLQQKSSPPAPTSALPLNPNTSPDISGPDLSGIKPEDPKAKWSDIINWWEDTRKVNPKNNINLTPFKTVLENNPNLIDTLKTLLPLFEIKDVKYEYRGADRIIVKWKTEDAGIKTAVDAEKQDRTEPFELKSLKFKYAQMLNEKKEKAKEGEEIKELPLNLEEKVYYSPKDDLYYTVLESLKGGEYYEKTDKDYVNGSASYVFKVDYLEGDKITRTTSTLPFTTLNRLQTILYLYYRIFGEEENLDFTGNMNPKECKGARCDGATFWYDSGLTFEGIKYAVMHDPLRQEFISRFERTVSEKGSLLGVERLFSTIHDRIYPEDLAKAADQEGLNFWREQIDTKKISWEGAISYFFLSSEYNKNLIVSQGLEKTLASFSYLTTLGRPGVEKDLEWLKQQYGTNSKEMRREILGDFVETENKQTREVTKTFQFKKEPKERIEKIDKEVGRDQALGYLYLGVLGRPIDPDGLKFYKEKMEKEGLTFEQTAQMLFESKEFKKFGEPAFAKEAMGKKLE
ncbi:MAG: hypothetical protein AB1465_01475 [Patescibacteria group bacterium]